MIPANLDFEIDRQDLSTTRVVTTDKLPSLSGGQVRLRIDRFALTANNITYALVGDQLDYWGFFPAANGWGRIPAMGWADAVESNHPEIAVGGRYYGWYPMSRYVTIDARPSPGGLVDAAPHRAAHAPIYRSYTASSLDPLYDADREDEHALLRGLFATAFLADDFLVDNGYGAATTIVLSASSKTAIGVAFQARARAESPIVGVTSDGNRAFVESLGLYDQVVTYGDVTAIATAGETVIVDMAGNADVVRRVHDHLGAGLRYSMAIGLSHGQAAPPARDLPGPQPAFFFAPTQGAKRVEEWGAAGYQQRLAAALRGFVEASSWLTIEHADGPDATAAVYQTLLAGKLPPHRGQIASLHVD